MSKSVDQTVLDYFSLLLSEESKEGSDDLVPQNHNAPLLVMLKLSTFLSEKLR